MEIKKETYGSINGQAVYKYTLNNSHGSSAEIINYGGTLLSCSLPDRDNNYHNVTLGYSNLDHYRQQSFYIGALIGRFGNRIANSSFTLNGKEYSLTPSEGNNQLHGGKAGFNQKVWLSEDIKTQNSVGVKLQYHSKDGEEGFPGNLDITVNYSLTDDNELIIEYLAGTDQPTPINLTQHSYWNLSGNTNNTILDHQLQLNCDHFLEVDDELIPTGEIKSVTNSPMDFRQKKPVGEDIAQVEGGYDHCYVINRETKDSLEHAATLFSPGSGREMKITTTKPAIQFYSGNALQPLDNKDIPVYNKHTACCLETQYYPDAVNHDNFPSCILNPGEQYHHVTAHTFDIK